MGTSHAGISGLHHNHLKIAQIEVLQEFLEALQLFRIIETACGRRKSNQKLFSHIIPGKVYKDARPLPQVLMVGFDMLFSPTCTPYTVIFLDLVKVSYQQLPPIKS